MKPNVLYRMFVIVILVGAQFINEEGMSIAQLIVGCAIACYWDLRIQREQ